MDITKQVALITGGASGIGLGIAKELLENGIKGVSIVDINSAGIEIARELNAKHGTKKVIFTKADVSDKSELKSAFQKTVDVFGNLDIVFNNAGILNEIDPESCYKVNVMGATNCLKLAMNEYLPKYKSSSHGIIINTASIVALNPTFWTSMPCYSASKCFLIGLTQSFSQELHYKRSQVKVMAICPGVTKTSLLSADAVLEYVKECIEQTEERGGVQEVEDLVKHIIPILKEDKNGSIWKLEDKKRSEVYIPKIERSED